MNRGERRRLERERKKAAKEDVKKDNLIHLQNPVADHFQAFIAGNVAEWQKRTGEEPPMLTPNSRDGGMLAICGAGPSLAEEVDRLGEADEVWGCNSAAVFLHERGHPVTHAFTVDQTPHMVAEWESAPPLKYLLASSSHPHLVKHLVEKGRDMKFFHNFVGIKERPVEYDGMTMSYEDWLYHALWPPSLRTGSGLNSVTRAVDAGFAVGFDRLMILGADCAIRFSKPPPDAIPGSPESMRWLENHTTMHADGGNAVRSGATAVTLQGEIDGRTWVTKPDMAVSASCLIQMKKKFGDRVELVGDTLPNALTDKGDEFLKRLPNFVDREGEVIPLVT